MKTSQYIYRERYITQPHTVNKQHAYGDISREGHTTTQIIDRDIHIHIIIYTERKHNTDTQQHIYIERQPPIHIHVYIQIIENTQRNNNRATSISTTTRGEIGPTYTYTHRGTHRQLKSEHNTQYICITICQ